MWYSNQTNRCVTSVQILHYLKGAVMKRYFQDAYRVGDGDVMIDQYSETLMASGIIVPKRIGVVSIEGHVETSSLVARMNVPFHYEPDPTEYKFDKVEEPEATQFSLEPLHQKTYCRESVSVILAAVRSLTYAEVGPGITFKHYPSASGYTEDDKRTLDFIAFTVVNTVNGVEVPLEPTDEQLQAGGTGQYL